MSKSLMISAPTGRFPRSSLRLTHWPCERVKEINRRGNEINGNGNKPQFIHPPADVGLPDFLKVDIEAKTISANHASGDKRSTKIENLEKIDGKVIIQGAEDGVEDVKDGVGRSLAVAEESGKMALTASGDDVGFVLFGASTRD